MRGTQFRVRLRRLAAPVLWFAGFMVFWQILVVSFKVPDYLLPAPSEFLIRIVTDYKKILPHAGSTIQLVIVGFFAGTLPAIPLGYLIAAVPFFQRTLYPLLVFVNVVPKIALIPLLLIWFGFGAMPKIILAILLTFFPVLIDSMAGFSSIDHRLYFISRSMGASWWQTLWHIRIPSAMPFIFSGLKISIVLAVTIVIVAEFIGSNEGLGVLIVRAMTNRDLALMFAALFVASFIGLLLSAVVQSSERLLMPWTAYRGE